MFVLGLFGYFASEVATTYHITGELGDDFMPEYSVLGHNTPTNTAVDFLRRHGIDAPNGVGEIKMPWWFPNVNRANPKDMYMQIISAGGVNISKVQEGF